MPRRKITAKRNLPSLEIDFGIAALVPERAAARMIPRKLEDLSKAGKKKDKKLSRLTLAKEILLILYRVTPPAYIKVAEWHGLIDFLSSVLHGSEKIADRPIRPKDYVMAVLQAHEEALSAGKYRALMRTATILKDKYGLVISSRQISRVISPLQMLRKNNRRKTLKTKRPRTTQPK